MSLNLGSGYFINFSENEENEQKKLSDFLEKHGYTCNADGIKKYLLDTVDGKNNSMQRVTNIIQQNPELLQMGIKGITNFINKKRAV